MEKTKIWDHNDDVHVWPCFNDMLSKHEKLESDRDSLNSWKDKQKLVQEVGWRVTESQLVE